MQVILLERVEKLGQMGDVVEVKAGFARNFLLPQRKALRATRDNIARFESQRVQLEAVNLERRAEAADIATRLEGLAVVLVRQASESAQLYGSVTPRDIAAAVSEAGFTIERRQVNLAHPIKTLGLHQVRISLHPEVSATITVNVARSPDEAKTQARGETPGLPVDEIEEAEPPPELEEPAAAAEGAAGER